MQRNAFPWDVHCPPLLQLQLIKCIILIKLIIRIEIHYGFGEHNKLVSQNCPEYPFEHWHRIEPSILLMQFPFAPQGPLLWHLLLFSHNCPYILILINSNISTFSLFLKKIYLKILVNIDIRIHFVKMASTDLHSSMVMESKLTFKKILILISFVKSIEC